MLGENLDKSCNNPGYRHSVRMDILNWYHFYNNL